MKRFLFICLIVAGVFLGVLVLGGILLFSTNSYPVAFVGSQPIINSTYLANVRIATYYYNKINNTYNGSSTVALDQKEIGRAALDKLIEDDLIQDELSKRMNSQDLNRIVNDKIDSVLKTADSNIDKEVSAIYGVGMADFKKFILVPQAKRDILEGRLLLDNNKQTLNSEGDVLSAWLSDQKAKARVTILIPEFSWNKGVVAK